MAGGGRFNGRKFRKSLLRFIRKNLLLLLIILGCILGFIIGTIIHGAVQAIRDPEEKATTLMLIGFPGELLMNMLKMMILPMIIASLICSTSSLDAKVAGRIGRRTLIYYLGTTFLASTVGVLLAAAIKPGEIGEGGGDKMKKTARNLDGFLDVLRSLFPSNLVEAAVFGRKTTYKSVAPVYKTDYNLSDINGTLYNRTVLIYPGSDFIPSGTIMSPGTNVLGIVVFSIIFGGVLGQLGEKGETMKRFFQNLNDIVMVMVRLAMWYSPIGICSLITQKVTSMPNVAFLLTLLGKFIATVLTGLVIHGLVLQPLIYFIITRKNPYKFIFGIRDAIFTAFGTSSSAATMPTTLRCVEENNKIDPRVSRFVIPLGTTVNMDGGAFYEGVAALFIAQLNQRAMSFPHMIVIVLAAAGASIGAAAIPSAGLVTTVIVLQAVGLPLNDIGLIVSVDWFIDRCRTATNIMGDAFGSGIVGHLSRNELDYHYGNELEPMNTKLADAENNSLVNENNDTKV